MSVVLECSPARESAADSWKFGSLSLWFSGSSPVWATCSALWCVDHRGKVPGIRGKLVHFPCGFPVVPLCGPLVVPCSVWTIGESAADSWKYGSLSLRFFGSSPVWATCSAL